jgi:glycosidase
MTPSGPWNSSTQPPTNADFNALKELDLANPTVLDALIKCYKYWIGVTDVDGFRMDTVGHTEPEQTAIFCNAIREYAISIGKHNFMLFAEIVDSDARIQKYTGANKPEQECPDRFPLFDACLDFPLYFLLEEVIKGTQPPCCIRERYERFRYFYRDYSAAGRYFVTFIDNHDQMSRPYRRFMHGETDPQLAVLGIAFLLANMGIPIIYYGTEQGFDGAGPTDDWVRECMFGGKWGAFDTTGVQFFNPQHPIYRGIAQIAAIRASERALRYGREYFREISGNGKDFGHPLDGQCTLAFSRVLDITEIVVALNLTTEPRSDWVLVDANLTPPGTTLLDLVSGVELTVVTAMEGQSAVRVPLQSRQVAILKAKPA